MDILLIDPPYVSLKGMAIDRGYNMGLTSLAAYLRSKGIDTAVLMGDLLIEAQHNLFKSLLPGVNQDVKKYAAGQQQYEMAVHNEAHVVWEKIADVVNNTHPKYVGISYLTPLKCVVEKIAHQIKEIDRDIPVIAGSFHPTFVPDEVLQNRDIDFVVRGEGEIPLLHLIDELKKDSPNLDIVPGLSYRDKDGQVKHNPAAGIIQDLDELPFPARDLVLNCNYDFYRLHSVITARGCPYTCSFCADRRLWGSKVRRRSVSNVIKELKLLNDNYNVSCVDIVDGTFTYDRKYVRLFCKAIIQQQLNIKWRCTARYDNLDADLIQLMKQANCNGLYFGLESGSDRVLKTMDKKIVVEKIIEVSKMVYESGIPSAASILLGLPDEGKQDIEDTLKLMRKVKTDLLDVNSYIPLPGTPLYDAMTEEEKISIDWRKVGYKSLESYFSNSLSHDDFKQYRAEAYKIANNVRIKTIIRLGTKMLFQRIAGLFRKSPKLPRQPQAEPVYIERPSEQES